MGGSLIVLGWVGGDGTTVLLWIVGVVAVLDVLLMTIRKHLIRRPMRPSTGMATSRSGVASPVIAARRETTQPEEQYRRAA